MSRDFYKFSMFYIRVILSLFIIFCSLTANDTRQNFKFEFSKNGQNIWWLENNNFGVIPNNHLYSHYSLKKNNYDFFVSAYLNDQSNIFHQSFLKYYFKNQSFIKIGKFYRDYSLYLNDQLSSGHMIISHNALPVPKIGFVLKKKKWSLDFTFGMNHGELDKNSFYNKKPFLHEKFFYLDTNTKSGGLLSLGLVHSAIWGGSTAESGNQPSGFNNFLRVFFAEDRKIEDYATYPDTHANALGNHVGIWDLLYQKKMGYKNYKIYYQHFFEDTSGLRFMNEIDGLWGFEISDEIKNFTLLIEYLHTTSQDIDPPYVNESYYNHGTYKKGWSYKGYALGNPFISFGYQNVIPVNVFHIGFSKKFKNDFEFSSKISKVVNFEDQSKYFFGIRKSFEKMTIEINYGSGINNPSAQFKVSRLLK
tara:strand:- start:5597 stop:6853 length:1257 start_codon:yes stop_codon:yes gene_type:complete